jgi:hypothetical protein
VLVVSATLPLAALARPEVASLADQCAVRELPTTTAELGGEMLTATSSLAQDELRACR